MDLRCAGRSRRVEKPTDCIHRQLERLEMKKDGPKLPLLTVLKRSKAGSAKPEVVADPKELTSILAVCLLVTSVKTASNPTGQRKS
jgi:hypothetical protein